MRLILAILLLLLPVNAYAWPDGSGWSSDVLSLPGSTTLPTGCTDKQVYVDTDATSGQRIYLCESGSWVLQGDGGAGGGSVAGSNQQIQYNNSGSFGGATSFIFNGSNVGVGTTTASTRLTVNGTTTSTAFSGPLTGNVTGNADTVTTNANLTGDVTSVGNATTIASANKAWQDGGTNIYQTTTTDSVGIGTINPAAFFSVGTTSQFQVSNTGTVTTTGSIALNAANPSFSNNSSSATAVTSLKSGSSASARLVLMAQSGGANIMTLLNGNVGIGTTTPNDTMIIASGNVGIGTPFPRNALQINGTLQIDNVNSMGWSAVASPNAACNATCTSACVIGFDQGTLGVSIGSMVSCTDNTADECLCAGPN